MATADELWAWISPPIQELAYERAQDHEKPWATLRTGFVTATGQHPVADEMVRHLDGMSDDERFALLDDKDRLEGLAYQIVQQSADATEKVPAAGYDEAAWQRYLAENGAQWNGTDAAWPQFMEWFRYYADQQGLADPANSLLSYLNGQSTAERIATFAQYGVTIAPPQSTGGSLIMATVADFHEAFSAAPDFATLPPDKQAELVAQVRAALGG